MKNKTWIRAAIIREIIAGLTTFLSMIICGVFFESFDIWYALATSAVSIPVAFLTFIFYLPEAETDGALLIDTSNPDRDIYRLELRNGVDDLSKKSIVRFDVDTDVILSQK